MSLTTKSQKSLSNDQIRSLAGSFGITYAAAMAVVKTETNGFGFYPDTLIPVVRFENHIFHKKTNGIYAMSHPHLSSESATNKFNKKGVAEFARFQEAYQLNKKAAIWSTSWGIGQVMGFNFKACSYSSLETFMDYMFISEEIQLIAMFNFIDSNKLIRYLIAQDWKSFALRYNGKDYAKNDYDNKLAKYFKQYS